MFYSITNHSLLSVLCGTETLFVSLLTHGHPTRLVIKSDIRGPLQRIDTKLISKMRNKVFYWILEDFFVWFGLDFVLVEKYSSSQHGVGQIWGILQKISEDSFTFDFEVKAISVQSRRSIHVLFYCKYENFLVGFFFQDRISHFCILSRLALALSEVWDVQLVCSALINVFRWEQSDRGQSVIRPPAGTKQRN